MITEDQHTNVPDDLNEDTDIATTERKDTTDPIGEVSELDDVEEVSTVGEYDDGDIDDMSDES